MPLLLLTLSSQHVYTVKSLPRCQVTPLASYSSKVVYTSSLYFHLIDSLLDSKQSGLCLHYLIQTAFVKIINVFHIVKSKESFLILSFGDFLEASKTVHCSFLL